MKRLFTTILALLILTVGYSQTVYWTAYSIEVEDGMEENVVKAIDQFMNTETGKVLPAAVLTGKIFANSTANFTHRIVFSTTDKAV